MFLQFSGWSQQNTVLPSHTVQDEVLHDNNKPQKWNKVVISPLKRLQIKKERVVMEACKFYGFIIHYLHNLQSF